MPALDIRPEFLSLAQEEKCKGGEELLGERLTRGRAAEFRVLRVQRLRERLPSAVRTAAAAGVGPITTQAQVRPNRFLVQNISCKFRLKTYVSV